MRIALYQGAPKPLDVPGNLQRLRHQAQLAAERGAQLLVCPEMFLTGYNIGLAQVERLAEAADGPAAMTVVEIAQAHRIAIVYGYPERGDDGAIYNSVQLIDAHGRSLSNYRKTHLFGDMDRAQFSAGDAASQLFEWQGWRLGLLICYDVEFPETVRLLALQGADAVLVPTANMMAFDEVPNLLVPARACENRVFVAYANACGNEPGVHYGGLSTVAGPDGGVWTRAGRDAALLRTTLMWEALTGARRSSPLPARRRDLYGPLAG